MAASVRMLVPRYPDRSWGGVVSSHGTGDALVEARADYGVELTRTRTTPGPESI
jgi:hypothetical protein